MAQHKIKVRGVYRSGQPLTHLGGVEKAGFGESRARPRQP